MYSTTITPRTGVRSDGQLHRHPPAPPRPTPAPPPKPKAPALRSVSAEQILIIVIAYLLLQSDSPDWWMILALVYILF